MANKLIVAAAGSGKTTYIVKESLRETSTKTLVTTFTDANAREITRKFYEVNGCVPGHVVVQTWFSFLLEHGVKPFQGSLTNRRISGVFLTNGRSSMYVREDDFERYYLTSDLKVYSDKLSKLVVRCNEKSDGSVLGRITRIFRRIFIDEVQDMSGYDLDLIKLLMGSGPSLLMVGDPRQTTYSTHSEARHSRYRNGKIQDFIEDECRNLCETDCTSFATNYRCNEAICRLANQLFPEYPPCSSGQEEVTGHDGVFLVQPTDVARYLAAYQPVQLRHSSRVQVKHESPAMNFGNAKGLTLDRVLLYPTNDFVRWLKDRSTRLEPQTRCKLYVALTRAKYSASIVLDSSDRTNIGGVEKFSFDD